MDTIAIREFEAPMLTQLTSLSGGGLSLASEQQQQQQQQQNQQLNWRRFLNAKTQLPMEEIVTQLTRETKIINEIAAVKKA